MKGGAEVNQRGYGGKRVIVSGEMHVVWGRGKGDMYGRGERGGVRQNSLLVLCAAATEVLALGRERESPGRVMGKSS